MQKLQNPISHDEGWSIQVYGSDRRLICSLYPSHAWTFAVGILAGFVIAFFSISHNSPTSQREATPLIKPSSQEIPIQLD